MELLVYTKLSRERFQKESFQSENDILLCVLEGAFEVKSDAKRICVEKNQAFLFRKGVAYERRILRPMKLLLFRYESDPPLFPCEHLVFRDTARFASTLALCEKCGGRRDALQKRSQLLLDLSLQYEIESGERRAHQKDDAAMHRVAQSMRERIDREISVVALAKECALSHVQLIRRFKKAFGCTPSEYIAHLRLERARALLSQTDMQIKAVAKECGFENEYYFSNFFKMRTGLCPTAFRSMTE